MASAASVDIIRQEKHDIEQIEEQCTHCQLLMHNLIEQRRVAIENGDFEADDLLAADYDELNKKLQRLTRKLHEILDNVRARDTSDNSTVRTEESCLPSEERTEDSCLPSEKRTEESTDPSNETPPLP